MFIPKIFQATSNFGYTKAVMYRNVICKQRRTLVWNPIVCCLTLSLPINTEPISVATLLKAVCPDETSRSWLRIQCGKCFAFSPDEKTGITANIPNWNFFLHFFFV
jgi:hypothetical protein